MKKILAIFTLLAGVASAQSFIRTHTIVSDNSTFPSPANVEWMSGESVRFEITAKSGNFYIPLSNGVAPVLKMWSGNVITQLYAQKTGTIYSAGSGKLYVDLLANEANITPTGAYNYAIGVYDGTQYMGVVAQGRATIRGHPFGASVGYVGSFNAFPYVPSNDAAYLNAITNIIAGTNITVSRSGRQVTMNSSASGVGTGTLYRIESQVSGLGFTTPNGPTAFLTGTVATAGSFADTNSVGVISTNAVNQATNFVSRAGDTMTGNLIITNASITVKSDSINAQFSDARGAAGVLLQTGSPSAATNTYGVVKLQDSGPSAGYGTLYFDSRVSPTGLWIKASGTNRWNVWDQRNDGAGSGLDADLLDGFDSTNFALLSSSPTFTGTVTAATFIGDGTGLTNVTAYQLGDIRIYGAATNADATAAIASALAVNNSVFIPAGTWTASNIVVSGTKTIYGVGYESRLSMAASATGALINAAASGATVRVRGLSLSGGSEISRATNTAAGSRHGVQYATQDNLGSRFNQMWISGFTGYGIYGNEVTYTGNLNDALRISEVTVSNCYGGIVTAGRSELVSVTDCFAGYNSIGFRAGAGNTQIKGCTAANNGIDYDVTAAGANDAHGIINDCKAISVPARYTVRVSTNTQGFVFSGNSFYHGGILLEASKGALFVGNQISATFVADRGGGSGTNFFINNIFGTGDANVLSNSANTIYHAGNYDINGNRMWSEVEPLYSLPSSISATQLTAGTIATAIDGRNITNITAASTSGVSSISATGAVSGAIVFQGSGVTQSGNTFTFTGGTGGTASASSIVAAWAVNVYQAPISTQAAYIKVNFTNIEYNLGSVYNPTNFNLTLPTGWVSMAISRSVASQSARQIIPLYKNGSEMLAAYGTARFFDDVDGATGSTGGSTHPLQFFNDSATNVFSVYCWWNTATRTNASFRWSGSVQN